MSGGRADLAPHLPRVVLDWYRDEPDRRWCCVDGTLVFVDVSGFTAMSERLARLGREGAEAVTEVVNGCFTDLLAVAYEADGSLLKFGGDALLLLFTGDGHVERGVAAAHGMRATLRRVGRVQTPVGAVQLRMSAGVHTGPIHLFLVGGSHRELLVTGPGASAVVAAEAGAGAGRIVVSETTAASLGAAHLGELVDGGFVLRRVSKAVPAVSPSVHRAGDDVRDLVSAGLRDHLTDTAREVAEHRSATVAFVHFDGTDTVVSTLGPEVLAVRLDRLVRSVQHHADEHGVCFLSSDVDGDGGKIVLTAGVPSTRGDDDERMLRALRGVLDDDPPLALHIGVHRGPLFAGELGPPYRRTYTVMGDVVNTAARVMSRAAVGEVLATDAVLANAGAAFEVEAIEPFQVKGKRLPLEASRVLAVRTAGHGVLSAEITIGRADELATLSQHLQHARGGAGGLVQVVGEAGVGKSHLASLLAQVHPEVASVFVRCHRTETSAAYAPLRAALYALLDLSPDASVAEVRRVLAATVDDLDPRLRARLPLLEVVLGVASERDQHEDAALRVWRSQLHDAVGRMLDAGFPDGVVLVVEDAHWIDEPSADLLAALATRSARGHHLILITRLPGESSLDAATEAVLALQPLATDDAARLARSCSQRGLLLAEARAIAERAAGNPLFVRALVAAIDAHGLTTEDLPGELEALFGASIDRLDAGDRAVLRQLAVLGPSFDVADAAHLLERDPGDLRAQLGRLGDFLAVEGDVVEFRQSLVLDAAYAGLPYRRRRELHARAGRRIEARAPEPALRAEILSAHFDAARDDERAWHYSRLAGERAIAQHAWVAATVHFRRALTSAKRLDAVDDTELSQVWESLGRSLLVKGRPADAVSAIRRARQLARDDDVATARLALFQGEIRRKLGQYVGAMRWYRRGLSALEGRVPLDGEAAVQWVRLAISCGTVRFDQTRYHEARADVRRALEVAERAGDDAGVAHAALWLQQIATRLRDPSGRVYGQLALRIYDQLGVSVMAAQVLNALGNDAFRFGRWDEALGHFGRGREQLVELGDSLGAAVVASNMGEILAAQGRWDDAATWFEEARATFAAAGHPYEAVATANLGRTAGQRGELLRAEGMFTAAEQRLMAVGLVVAAEEVRLHRAELLAVAGDGPGAEDALWAMTGADDDLACRVERARALARLVSADVAGAETAAAAALEIARSTGDDYDLGVSLALVAMVGERRHRGLDDVAADARAEATTILARLGVVSLPWDAPRVLGRDERALQPA